jgi:hypothetical protein
MIGLRVNHCHMILSRCLEYGRGTSSVSIATMNITTSSIPTRTFPARAGVDLMLYCTCKPANNVLFCRDRIILCLISRPLTCRKARNPLTPIRTAEKGNRLAERGHPVLFRSTLRSRGCNDTVERRTKDVIAPSSKEISRVHDNSSGLKETDKLKSASHLLARTNIPLGLQVETASYGGSQPRAHRHHLEKGERGCHNLRAQDALL